MIESSNGYSIIPKFNKLFLLIRVKEINILNSINIVLKERHEIESNYNHLHLKFNQIQTDETERKEKVKFLTPLTCAPKFFIFFCCLVPFSTK